MKDPEQQKRISYSEFKNWKECPYRHKLVYIDKVPYYSGNEFTAFGSSIHASCEEIVQNHKVDPYEIFKNSFKRELSILKEENINVDKELVLQMQEQARNLCKNILPSLEDYFQDYEVISVEEPLMEEITEITSYGKKFKGFIDLVIKTSDEKYHIIDWKTCSWGWPSSKKTDPIVNYQLTYYKNYFSKKHKINPENIETYFALLKRTAKKESVEIFRVTSGSKKTTNALKILENAVINIEKGNYIKNRLSCKYCKYHNTEYCK